jgi:aminomethyltransferase
VLLNERGGIIDDTVITKHASDAFYVVTNAGRRVEDLAWFAARLAEWNASERAKDGPVEHELLDGWGLLALQGTSYLTWAFSKVSVDDLGKRTNNRSCFG